MNQENLDAEYLGRWIGRQETVEEKISVEPLRRMRATLDYAAIDMASDEVIPPLWHSNNGDRSSF